jgi:hypothetical protein
VSAISRYRKLYPRIWRHPGFQKLKPTARELALYLLTGPQTNGLGLFYFSIGTACEDLNVGRETFLERLADVQSTFGWFYDADARVMFLPSWWRWNRPENENVLKGILKALNEIPPCALVESFARNLETLPETYRQTFVECCRERLRGRTPNQEQDPEPVSGTQNTSTPRADGNPVGTPKPKRPKNGSDEGLVPIARQVLGVTNPGASMDHLIDAFYSIDPNNRPPKGAVLEALNRALSERRGA